MDKRLGVRDYYNQYSTNYDTFYESIQQTKFLEFSSLLPFSPVVFDLGGGSGLLSNWLNTFIINLDLSYEMLQIGLKSRYYQAIACDLEYLPIRNSSINTFISLTAIQNVSNQAQCIAEIGRSVEIHFFGILTSLIKTTDIDQLSSLIAHNLCSNITKLAFSGEDYILMLQN